jgi:hypothetical protein
MRPGGEEVFSGDGELDGMPGFFAVLGPKEMPKIVAETFQAAHTSNLVGTNNLIQPFQLQQASARSPTDRRLE